MNYLLNLWLFDKNTMAFKNVLGRLPNREEQHEIQEMIQMEGSKIRELVKNWK